MAVCCTECVVLRNFHLGESDLVSALYTKSLGRLSGVARGARRAKSHFTGKLEPLSWSEVVLFSRDGRDLASIDKVDLIQSFGQKCSSYRCLMQLNLVAELVFQTTPEREPNDRLFRLLILVLPQLTQPETADLAQSYFEVWYLRLAGLFPDHRHCQGCGAKLIRPDEVRLGPARTGFFCPSCSNSQEMLSTEAFELLSGICGCHLTELSRSAPALSAIQELGEFVEALLQRSFERSFHCLKLIHQTV